MKNVKTKKVLKVTLFTTLVLGSIGLTLYPITNSRFIKSSNDETVLKFKSNINNLYGGSTELGLDPENQSTGENLFLKLNFNRNEVLRRMININRTDTYYIDVPQYCHVYNNDVNSTTGSAELVLTNDMQRDINVYVDCVPESIANNNSGNVTIPIKVYEKFANEEKFIYWNFYYYGGTLDEYYKEVGYNPNPSGEDPVQPAGYTRIKSSFSSTIFSEFINALKAVSGDDYNTVISYMSPGIKTTNATEFINTINNAKDVTGIDAILYEPTGTRTEYILDFRISSNIVGYAKTDHEIDIKKMIFSSKDEAVLREALHYYLKTHYYKNNNDEAAETIANYIISQGEAGNNLNSIIYGNVKVPTVSKESSQGEGGENDTLVITENTLAVAKNFKTPDIIRLDYKKDDGSFTTVLQRWIIFANSLHASKLIPPANLDKFQNVSQPTLQLYTAFNKNTSDGYEDVNEFFIYDNSVYDTNNNLVGEKQYLIMNVTSNNEKEHLLVTLNTIDSNLDISFTNSTTEVVITVKYNADTTADEKNLTINALQEYLGTTIDNSNTVDEGSTLTITVKKVDIQVPYFRENVSNHSESLASESLDDSELNRDNIKSIPESEIINNMQVRFLNAQPLEGVLSESLIVTEQNKAEGTMCPPEAGVQSPCVDLPVTNAKEDDYSTETEIFEESGITA